MSQISAPSQTNPSLIQMRSALLDLVQGNQIHAFLTAAPEYLEKKKSDTEVVIQVLQGLVTLGLGGPARELVEERREFASLPGAEELRKSLDQLPEGRVSWDSLRRQFDRNAESLCSVRPEWREQIKTLPQSLEGFDLYQSVDGFHHLSRRAGSGLRRWVPALVDSAALESLSFPSSLSDHAAVVVGVGLNSLIDRMCASIRPRSDGVVFPVYVIDELLYPFSAWLHTADHTTALLDERIAFFIGAGAEEQYEECLRRHEDMPIPGITMISTRAESLGNRIKATGLDISERRGDNMVAMLSTMRKWEKDRDTAAWLGRFTPGSMVLGFTSRTTTVCRYSMRDMGEAIESLGYRFRMVMEESKHQPLTNYSHIRAVAQEDPALVLFINHFRNNQEANLGDVPVLTWIQDPMPLVFSRETGRSLGTLDFCCGYYKDLCVGEFGYPEENFISTPFVPISPRVFHDALNSPADQDHYECDVAYIGHYPETPESLLRRAHHEFGGIHLDFLDGIRDRIMDIIRTGRAFTFLDAPVLIRDAAQDQDLSLDSESCWRLGNYFAYRLYDLHFRRETLAWVASWAERYGRRFKLYGNGWDQHSEFCQFAVGPIEHGDPLRKAYRGAKIVIQTIPSGLNHQRTYEALACGSTVLGRYSPLNFGGMPMDQFRKKHGNGSDFSGSLYDYGFRGLDRVVFNNAEEFSEKAEAVMRGDETIEAARRELRQCVLEHFTYEAAFRHILKGIRSSAPVAVSSP